MAGLPTAGDIYAGRYRVVRHLGHGGLLHRFQGMDLTDDRMVTLTVLAPRASSLGPLTQRVSGEVSLLAMVRSAHLVEVQDHGTHADTVYFVTAFFPDGDLGRWVTRYGPPDRGTALGLIVPICAGVADLHAAGLLHRDLKPGHVLLGRRVGMLVPLLSAIGVGLDGRDSSVTAGLPHTGTLVGDPAYLAPERHFGHVADVRGDVYSLGCLLWTALTGTAPYQGTDYQVMNAHINAPVRALRTRDPIDRSIDQVLARAMSKDPDQRFHSARALQARLTEILEALGSATQPLPADGDAGA